MKLNHIKQYVDAVYEGFREVAPDFTDQNIAQLSGLTTPPTLDLTKRLPRLQKEADRYKRLATRGALIASLPPELCPKGCVPPQLKTLLKNNPPGLSPTITVDPTGAHVTWATGQATFRTGIFRTPTSNPEDPDTFTLTVQQATEWQAFNFETQPDGTTIATRQNNPSPGQLAKAMIQAQWETSLRYRKEIGTLLRYGARPVIKLAKPDKRSQRNLGTIELAPSLKDPRVKPALEHRKRIQQIIAKQTTHIEQIQLTGNKHGKQLANSPDIQHQQAQLAVVRTQQYLQETAQRAWELTQEACYKDEIPDNLWTQPPNGWPRIKSSASRPLKQRCQNTHEAFTKAFRLNLEAQANLAKFQTPATAAPVETSTSHTGQQLDFGLAA